PRHHALRHQPRADVAPCAFDLARRDRHDGIGLLDPGAELMDAHTDRSCEGRGQRRRPLDRRRLVGRDRQSVVCLPLHAHAARLWAHGVLRRRRPLGLAAAARARRLGREAHAARGGGDGGDPRAGADVRGRPAWPQHSRAPARQDRGDGSALETERGMPLVLFALPNESEKRNDFAIELPKLGSFVLKHDFDAEVKGLNEFAPDTPPVAPLFFAFRAMVGIGVLMLLISWTGAWFSRAGRLVPRWLLWGFAGFTFAGWAATLCGWIVTEMG